MTPLELSVADGFISVGLIGFCAGLVWLIFAWLPRKWRAADPAAHIAAALETCLFCRGIDWCADCTCPKRCTAQVCLFGVRPAPRGPGQ